VFEAERARTTPAPGATATTAGPGTTTGPRPPISCPWWSTASGCRRLGSGVVYGCATKD